MSANLGNSAGPQNWKRSVFIPVPRRAMPKSVQTAAQLRSFLMLVSLCPKSFKLAFSRTWTENFQMYKLDLEKAEKPEIKLSTFIGSWRKQGNSRKTSTSISLSTLKPLTVCITTNCGKFWKRWEYQATWPASWETCMQVNKQQLELDLEWWSGSRLGKEYIKAVYCHSAYLISMQSTSCKMLGYVKHKLESRLSREISTISDMKMIPS